MPASLAHAASAAAVRSAMPRRSRVATAERAPPRLPACGAVAGRAAARRGRTVPRASAEGGEEPPATASVDEVPAGCARYKVRLSKPLGMVLESDADGNIFVVEILPDSAAARSGRISVGDQLIATSGVTYTTESNYGEVAVKGGQELVRVLVRNESFDTVMAAIGSHPGQIPVEMEFQQCE